MIEWEITTCFSLNRANNQSHGLQPDRQLEKSATQAVTKPGTKNTISTGIKQTLMLCFVASL
jgi:hypothetical protein